MSSDDSDFYGDEDTVAELQSRVDGFDVDGWWDVQKEIQTPLRIQAQNRTPTDLTRLHNPYAGVEYAWQLTESVDAFLDRLPPRTTEVTANEPWIYICNPFIPRVGKGEAENQRIHGCEDEAPEESGAQVGKLVEGGMERLHFVTAFVEEMKVSTKNNSIITRETNKAGADAAKDILGLAHALHVKCGKWMLFCESREVNEVWAIVAKATANNELGIAAKVAKRPNGDARHERLICVYTSDFADKKDVERVVKRLKALDLVPAKRPLYYKPDAFTYLGISSGNPWGLKASIYNSNEFLGKL